MPRAVKRLIAAIGGLLGVLVGLVALSVVIAVADGRAMAFIIEKAAAMALGRGVVIGHAAVVDWGRPAIVELTDVAVENAAWADEPTILRAERIRAAVALSGVFPPSVELPHVAVTAPAAFLAVSAEGVANWRGLASGSGAPPDTAADFLGLESFQVTDGTLTYRHAAAGAVWTVRLHGLRAVAPAVDRPITVEGQGQLATGSSDALSKHIRFSGELGSLRQVRQGELPVRATKPRFCA